MQVMMPQIGMTMIEGTVERWIKKDGDTVEKGEEIMEFFTEKMSNILEAPVSGALRVLAQEGEVVACGDPVAEIN